jgi:hypothetical protein
LTFLVGGENNGYLLIHKLLALAWRIIRRILDFNNLRQQYKQGHRVRGVFSENNERVGGFESRAGTRNLGRFMNVVRENEENSQRDSEFQYSDPYISYYNKCSRNILHNRFANI